MVQALLVAGDTETTTRFAYMNVLKIMQHFQVFAHMIEMLLDHMVYGPVAYQSCKQLLGNVVQFSEHSLYV